MQLVVSPIPFPQKIAQAQKTLLIQWSRITGTMAAGNEVFDQP